MPVPGFPHPYIESAMDDRTEGNLDAREQQADARRGAPSGSGDQQMSNPLENMTASVPSWGAKLAFGESTMVGGREVVPAALVMFGFGGGGGSGTWPEHGKVPGSRREGNGGGGGGYVLPIGAYVGGPDGLRFRPNPVAAIIVSVPLVTAVGWAVARIITSAKSGRTTT
jgi:uncharacterized spore protein YtfJ